MWRENEIMNRMIKLQLCAIFLSKHIYRTDYAKLQTLYVHIH